MTPELNKIYTGDCMDVMKTFPENFVDTILTDPPYGIGFMGKEWDRFDPKMIERRTKGYREKPVKDGLDPRITKVRGSASEYAGLYDQSLEGHRGFQAWCCAWATEALRIAKPGAMMLVSGGTRTFHRMTAGLEDAGWQIRDCLMWLYGSGFPKSHNLHGQFEGWGTALKPAWEPIILAMKPLDGTFAENAEKWGVAGLNVDGGRIAGESTVRPNCSQMFSKNGVRDDNGNPALNRSSTGSNQGRWPANLLLDEEAAGMLDGQSGGQMHSAGKAREAIREADPTGMFGMPGDGQRFGDSGGASRFFYVAKSGRAERNEGCDELPKAMKYAFQTGDGHSGKPSSIELTKSPNRQPTANNHPTVKPLDLMKYLCNLTRTPTGGIVLDPFAGSGTTLWAAEFHNRPWIGIEMNPEYVAIANARIARERGQIKMAI